MATKIRIVDTATALDSAGNVVDAMPVREVEGPTADEIGKMIDPVEVEIDNEFGAPVRYVDGLVATDSAGRPIPITPITGGGYAGPFDVLPAGYGMFSTKRLYAAYSGPVLRLRRSSDNAELDVSTLANGWLDEPAISAWRGGGAAFVTIWYDQTGNARHATQAVAANQAQLSANCRAAAFDGTNDTYAVTGSLAFARNVAGVTEAALASCTNVTGTARVYIHVTTGLGNARARIARLATSGLAALQSRKTDAEAVTTTQTLADTGNGVVRVIGRRDYQGATSDITVDGVTKAEVAGSGGANSQDTNSSALAMLGSTGAGEYLIGEATCFALFQSAISNAERTALNAALASVQAGL